MFCYSRNRVFACLHTGCAKRTASAKLDRVARPDFLNGTLFALPVRRHKAGATNTYLRRPRFNTHILKADGSTVKVPRVRRGSPKNGNVVTYVNGKSDYDRQMAAATLARTRDAKMVQPRIDWTQV